tara:strand:+ start:323 stop:847 length:525 start_codon:yes stop_codon:yes gene_type:complete
MWLEKLKKISETENKPIRYLNLNFEIHNALYLIYTLENIFEFSLNEDKLKIKKEEEEYSKDKFVYWWQIVRYQEIHNEEQKLINSFEEVKKKVMKLQKSLPKIEEEDSDKEKEKKQKKIEDINVKLTKLANWLNKEGPSLKQNLQILSNYRNIYSSEKSLNEILNWLEFYLINK